MAMDFRVADAALLDGLKVVMFELGKGARKGQWQIIRITTQGAKPR